MIKQKISHFISNINLQKKILIPYIIIIIIMVVLTVSFSIKLISSTIEKQLEIQLKEAQFYIRNIIDNSVCKSKDDQYKLFNKSNLLPGYDVVFFSAKSKPENSILYATPAIKSNNEALIALTDLIGKYLNNPQVSSQAFTWHNTDYKALFERLKSDESVCFAVLIASEEAYHVKKQLIITSIFILCLISFWVLGVYTIIIQRITKTIEKLAIATQKVAKGNWNQQIPIQSHDEIGILADNFNEMVKTLKSFSKKLIQEKERSDAILTSVPVGVLFTNLENQLILANHQAEKMFDFSENASQKKVILKFIRSQNFSSILKEALKEGQNKLSRQIEIPDQNGGNFTYLLTASLVLNSQSEPMGVITVIRDITPEKELVALREGFLRTITHELKTPLTTVIGFLELLNTSSSGGLSGQQQEYIKIVLREALSLKNLISDMLDLSHIKAGNVKLHYSSIQVKPLLEEILASFRSLVETKKVEVQLSDAVVDDLEIKTDGSKLRRIIVNLVSNSIKFTKKGYIRVSAEKKGKEIVFSVIDTGIGLKEDEKEVIFEKFRQVDYSSTRSYEGIGLGLSICQQLIELLQGKIWLESQHNKGTTFYFSLPINEK